MPEPTAAQKPPKRTLREKYDIPIHHLDFEYVRQCRDAREIERIYIVLQSGQEGHYPDLTRTARERLQHLHPGSRALRVEQPALQPGSLPDDEWRTLRGDLLDHVSTVQQKSQQLRAADREFDCELPAIRKQSDKLSASAATKPMKKAPEQRIKSCDYDQWDKYDVDTELTRMDLVEERARESDAIRDKRRVCPVDLVEQANSMMCTAQLNDIEQTECAERCRIVGNDHFRAGDYVDAIGEYTRSVAVKPTAVAYANRALACKGNNFVLIYPCNIHTFSPIFADLKFGDNHKAIRDCDACLALDATNVKAMLRKAQALQNEDRLTDAYSVYTDVWRIDAQNKIAAEAMRKISERLPGLPPAGAHRLKVVDVSSAVAKVTKVAAVEEVKSSPSDDFAALIMPKKIVPSKLSQMAQTMSGQNKKLASLPGVPATTAKPMTSEIRTRPQQSAGIRVEMPNNRTEYKNGVVIEEL